MFEELGRSLDSFVRRVSDGVNATRIDPKTDAISVPYPDAEPIKLRLEMGVGDLKVSAGADKLVDGTATYNIQEWTPKITTDGGSVLMKQGGEKMFWPGIGGLKNDWVLTLGTARPYDLTVSKGIVKAQLALGGLPLTAVVLEMGTGETKVNFDRMNPQRASRVQLKCGTGEMRATGLLNSNAASISVGGGTGQIYLGFTGDSLAQDMDADISLGVGESTIVLKRGIAARVKLSQGLGSTRVESSFNALGNHTYETPDFSTASGPKLTLKINSGVGSVTVMFE